MPARLLNSARVQALAAWAVGSYLEFTLRSTRWTLEGEANLADYLRGGAVIVAVWHDRLPVIPALWAGVRHLHPDRRVSALASRHRDGRLIASILARFGVRAVHGSSGRTKPGSRQARDHGGAAGLRGLIAALAAGEAVVITPDGPRGPRRVAAPGVAQLAALSGAPVLAVAGQVRWRLTLGSWDRMVVPLPFGRGALVCLQGLQVPRDGAAAKLPAIEAALTQAADRADALCRA
jgi:lysophospholipid acyltransferase (LPLAT)-like uncharacterized protein